MLTRTIGWLLGLPNIQEIESFDGVELDAAWASEGPFWVFLGVVALLVLSIFFYVKFQRRGPLGLRVALGIGRGLLLVLIFLTLAVPVARFTTKIIQRPALPVIIDATDSMAIQDPYTDQERDKLVEAVQWTDARSTGSKKEVSAISRTALIKSLLNKKEDNLLERLAGDNKYRLQVFLFDGNSASRLRKLPLNADGGEQIDPQFVAEQLTTKGQVTAIGSVLGDLRQQFGSGNLDSVVFVSDFANNSGAAPLGKRGGDDQSPASQLGVPVYTVGVGAVEAKDVSVDIQTDRKMKRAEKTNIQVRLRQTGLQGSNVNVRVFARRLSGEASEGEPSEIPIGQKTVSLATSLSMIDFPFTPKDSGRFEFVARVEPISGEVVEQNNRASREVNIIDDYLRLMYIANEPTWEWRFIKEVFHRDKLVGLEGFRTFLGSSDPRVRESNVLFLSTLTPKRSDFFANDVIFLGDMPQTTLSGRFCEMTKEYVGKFGGGLVVICGPRFGLRELADTPLADMLPVVIDRDAAIRDNTEFSLKLSPYASNYPFMQLGENDVENTKAWDNFSRLPWYQPVANLHSQATALAVHPTELCRDGKTPQPLIAVRKYGNGEVVYIGFNETWRLRRKYGELYYRQFWSQLIYRLGMSHALGSEKRFVVRNDRPQYRAEEKATLTIEAFDENFQALNEENFPQGALEAEMTLPQQGGGSQTRPLNVPLLRDGVFEARVPLYTAGQYSIRVKDPVTNRFSEVRFDVADLSAERRNGVRNQQLQQQLARETHGRSYDLTTVSQLPDDLQSRSVFAKTEPRVIPLWNTWLWFIPLIVLMLGEWLVRKRINLS